MCTCFCVSTHTDALVYVCPKSKKKRVSCSSFQANKAPCSSHGLLSGSKGSSVATRGLFCGCKLGQPWESWCYSRKGLFSSTFPLSLLLIPFSVLISQISLEKRRCGVYCSSKAKDSAALSSYLIAYGVSVYECVSKCVCVSSALQIILVSTQQLWLSTNRWNQFCK